MIFFSFQELSIPSTWNSSTGIGNGWNDICGAVVVVVRTGLSPEPSAAHLPYVAFGDISGGKES
jgi:hypothetical protein